MSFEAARGREREWRPGSGGETWENLEGMNKSFERLNYLRSAARREPQQFRQKMKRKKELSEVPCSGVLRDDSSH